MNSPQDQLKAFWDARYAAADYVYGTGPNTFLTTGMPPLAPGARVLCLADGEGRNGVWLARQGYRVTSVDIAAQGIAKARQLAAAQGVALDLRTGDVTRMPLGVDAWDAVVSIFLHLPPAPRRALHKRVAQALRPGGFFVWEAYGPGQLGQPTGGPQSAALLPAVQDVADDFAQIGCTVLHQWSGWREVREGALHSGRGAVTQFIARKTGKDITEETAP